MGSFAALQAEVAKCDVVCANCHRIRTHKAKVPVQPKAVADLPLFAREAIR
jgi:hypothetical protein